MLQSVQLDKLLFLDIETVSNAPTWHDLDETGKSLWKKKAKVILRSKDEELSEEQVADTYLQRAAIYAEFGKIVVISAGFLSRQSDGFHLRIKSYTGETEKELLQDFSTLLDQHYNMPGVHGLCGHNIREFDVPYLCRRLLINGLPLPDIINLSGKKPWETNHLVDTLQLWKFGDFKNYTSLDVLTYTLGIPSPKDDIDGSQVGGIYHIEKDVDRIATYCEKDVVAVTQLLLRLNNLPLIAEENIEIKN